MTLWKYTKKWKQK